MASSKEDDIFIGQMLSCMSYGPHCSNNTLLAIGGLNQLYILSCSEQDDDIDTTVLVTVPCIGLGQIRCIEWTDRAEINEDGQYYVSLLIAAGSDHVIYMLTLQQVGDDNCSLLEFGSHNDYINGLACNGNMAASVGDDLVCKIWNITKNELLTVLQLSSPGVSVHFHTSSEDQLLVSESTGVICWYNINSKNCVCSFESPKGSLYSCDVSFNQLISATANNDVMIWDTSQSSLPSHSLTFTSQQNIVKWCKQSDAVIASVSRNGQCHVTNIHYQKKMLSCSLASVKDMAWHPRLPLLSVLSNNTVNHYPVNV